MFTITYIIIPYGIIVFNQIIVWALGPIWAQIGARFGFFQTCRSRNLGPGAVVEKF